MNCLRIDYLQSAHIPTVMDWARKEGFSPGYGDIEIYRQTDRQGLWMAWLDNEPVGCIAGVRYNVHYGFIGMYIVVPKYRGLGYGKQLWKTALNHLSDLTCIGLEAAQSRVLDYSGWGFEQSSLTTRWCKVIDGSSSVLSELQLPANMHVVEGLDVASEAVQIYDAKREPSPRPHFLADWLNHPSGTVLAILDNQGFCHGFGRIRPCLMKQDKGWRIGPLLADTKEIGSFIIHHLCQNRYGYCLIDTPGLNRNAKALMENHEFHVISETMRMYRGVMPKVCLDDVFGLACLELG